MQNVNDENGGQSQQSRQAQVAAPPLTLSAVLCVDVVDVSVRKSVSFSVLSAFSAVNAFVRRG